MSCRSNRADAIDSRKIEVVARFAVKLLKQAFTEVMLQRRPPNAD
jgi:hypothetical protein